MQELSPRRTRRERENRRPSPPLSSKWQGALPPTVLYESYRCRAVHPRAPSGRAGRGTRCTGRKRTPPPSPSPPTPSPTPPDPSSVRGSAAPMRPPPQTQGNQSPPPPKTQRAYGPRPACASGPRRIGSSTLPSAGGDARRCAAIRCGRSRPTPRRLRAWRRARWASSGPCSTPPTRHAPSRRHAVACASLAAPCHAAAATR
mmetsp:Transcript_979/g.2587  ORF Transcript_979/g.2587 Transcript_979/m.2587 type:complete len:202 (+) Transcript_979:621-1226(+)